MGIRISQVPSEHKEKVVLNMLKQRGAADTLRCVEEDIALSMAFDWRQSPEGQRFWDDLDERRNTEEDNAKLAEFIAEAERRGFAIGVNTKHGLILDKNPHTSEYQEHELLSYEGEYHFFYHNIKVFKNGKWIKPLKSKQTASAVSYTHLTLPTKRIV